LDKRITYEKFFLKISGHQQRWPRPLPGAILIPQLCWWSLIVWMEEGILSQKSVVG
jgi:hypothetical protein